MNSDDIIAAVQRNISFPISQNTFQNTDILAFANEEMMISQVPSMLQFHEEYFVTRQIVALISNQDRYPIPTRAIGMKLRTVMWCDSATGPDLVNGTGGNLFEMTRIDSEDKAFFQANVGANRAVHKYYVEGNDIVLVPSVGASPQGSVVFYYFLRPNSLTTTDQAATIQNFSKAITLTNASIAANDTVTVTPPQQLSGVAGVPVIFTAVSGAPSTNQFQIGGTSAITATNLATAITTNGVASAVALSNVVTATYSTRQNTWTTSNTAGFTISTQLGCVMNQVPTTFTNGSTVDFLQTKPGHKIQGMDIVIPSNGIVALTINFTDTDVPSLMVTGDYVCLQYQCIIPMIPPDLHTGLCERVCARILAALGDNQGLQATGQKIQEIEKNQGMLLDNRTEGEPRKVLARHSLLRYHKMGTTRRL